MSKVKRDKYYWRTYRKVKSNVTKHINEVESASNTTSPENSNHSVTFDNFRQNIESQSEQSQTQGVDSLVEPPSNSDFVDFGSEDDFSSSFSESSDEDVTASCADNVDLNCELAAWANKYQISHSALRVLLKLLCPFHETLPKDPRTLMQTKRNIDIPDIDGGQYYHFGVEHGVKCQLSEMTEVQLNGFSFEDGVKIQVSIDGVPLFKSSNTQFWPILGRIISPCTLEPFIIGIFVGDSKPSCLQSYLQDFVSEMKILEQSAIEISANVKCQVSISCVICDTPARAFVKQVKGHTGYFGCDKCVTKGVWDGKMTFPEIDAPPRIDAQFDEMSDVSHHTGQSPIRELNIGMVSQFPLDYMHLVCLGVVKRLLRVWMRGPRQGQRIAASAVQRLSERLLVMRKFLSREFVRKGRSLNEVDRWKASEYRQFLLYTGPVCLKDILSPAVYKHFLLLFVGIYCLSSSEHCVEFCNYADQILRLFVSDFAGLYGADMIVYNVHGLVHLAADVEKFGPLENYSAFVFESFLYKLKKLVRKPNQPLQQVVGRLSEKRNSTDKNEIPALGQVKKEHRDGPLPFDMRDSLQFKEIQLPLVFLSTSKGDNGIMIGNKVALVRNLVRQNTQIDTFVVFEEFSGHRNFFSYPLESNVLDIFLVSGMTGELKWCKVSDIKCKCVLLPYNDCYVSIPMIHTV